MKDNTKKGGYNFIGVFRRWKDSNKGKFKIYGFENGELSKAYSDWEVISYKESLKEEKHGKNGKWHIHRMANLIAKK